MNPEPDKIHTPGASTYGSGNVTPDAGIDMARADYSFTQVPEDNQSELDEDVNAANPQSDREAQEDNVGNNQLGIIGRTSG